MFAEHLHRFGLIRFDDDHPVLALGAVADALKKPGATDGVIEIVHIVRHNNDPDLEKLIQAGI